MLKLSPSAARTLSAQPAATHGGTARSRHTKEHIMAQALCAVHRAHHLAFIIKAGLCRSKADGLKSLRRLRSERVPRPGMRGVIGSLEGV